MPLQAHIELLRFFLAQRNAIVENIQGLLNAQRKPAEYLQNGPLLSRHFGDCFFTIAGISPGQTRLRGVLEEAHWAGGFRPRDIPGLHNGLIDPAEMMVRAFHLWGQTRWPGRNGRIRYAHTLFNLYVIRYLTLASMRIWDAGRAGAGDALAQLQRVLDELWTATPADQPVFVRDARWLLQLAQSPATDDLGAYFDIAERIASTLSIDDRLEIHKAGVRMAGGHLRSQFRYYSVSGGVPFDDAALVVRTRTSNALDFALLIQELVPLLDAYEHACQSGDEPRRRDLADAICQGLSPDPELLVNRVELLGAYSMIEHLFVTTGDDDRATYGAMGQRHVRLIEEYEPRIGRLSKPLHEDCLRFRPVAGAYSPYGALYGFSSDLLEHMALKMALPDAVPRLGLEDVFTAGDAGKLAWVSGWRKLPHLSREIVRQFDYPQQFAEDVFDRVERALRKRVSDEQSGNVVPTGRLFVCDDDPAAGSHTAEISELPVEYVRSSDAQLAAAHKASAYNESQLTSERREGKVLVSYRTPGGWVAITKALLTEVLGAGRDVKIAGLPISAAGTLKLMCRDLVILPQDQ